MTKLHLDTFYSHLNQIISVRVLRLRKLSFIVVMFLFNAVGIVPNRLPTRISYTTQKSKL